MNEERRIRSSKKSEKKATSTAEIYSFQDSLSDRSDGEDSENCEALKIQLHPLVLVQPDD